MVSDEDIARDSESLFHEPNPNPNPNLTFITIVQQLQFKLGYGLAHKVDFLNLHHQQPQNHHFATDLHFHHPNFQSPHYNPDFGFYRSQKCSFRSQPPLPTQHLPQLVPKTETFPVAAPAVVPAESPNQS